ncbi:MAG TPA: ABC transporter ATP-binding protein [Candidatus Krumholzibacteria bacterium]|nr:ABC transporter ATP-binding protein [Candidatus Krumholzibacteria bacterium]HPD70289.1 ABC transporter ATP-binding protein [Candidatus Krumholzibacteria bacterium]HRY40011.1 ABC transporter ATP-binding protein [Candidatus Krumholzibacteria bacterium]
MSGEILTVRDLVVHRGNVPVLALPALGVRAGSVLALVGPNGSGKTTLLQTLAGLLEPRSGVVALAGEPLDSRGARAAYRKRVTLVFQEPLLFDTTVRANVESGLKLRRLGAADRAARLADVARRFGIAHLLDRSARKLSGGEAQRTSLARAFALKPEILFLDEPFSALDAPTREALIDDLARTLQETRTTAVLATHDQLEAMRLADTMAVLREGRIVQSGRVAEVINHPADELVAAFVGMETVLEGIVTSCVRGVLTVTVAGRDVQALGEARPGETVLFGVRPENVTLALEPGRDTSARNSFRGAVVRLAPRGPILKVDIDCGFFLTAIVTVRSAEDLALQPGREVVASFKATAVHVIRRFPPACG